MCIHSWKIDSNDCGVCRLCGTEKDFRPIDRKVFPDPQGHRYPNYLAELKVLDYCVQSKIPEDARLRVIQKF